MSSKYSGYEVEIVRIFVNGPLFKKLGNRVDMVTRTTAELGFTPYTFNYEIALESGEIRLIGVLSSDEAIAQLKQAKDKLDLGLIPQTKYDSLKTSLAKFIK